MRRTKLVNKALLAALLLGLLLVPLVVRDGYQIHTLITISILVILCTSLRLIYKTGLVSIAHGAFYAVGAYASALLTMNMSLPFWLALPVAGVIAATIGLGIGYPMLRIKGIYFFLASFALTAVLTAFLSNYFKSVFGGIHGLYGFPPPDSFGFPVVGMLDFTEKIPYYYLVLIVTVATVFIMHRLDRSRFGRTCEAIRESDSLAECVGVGVMKYKILAFVIASFFAGVAGSLLAHYYMSINPAMFSFQRSIVMVIALFVGGAAVLAGPIVGAIVLTGISQVFVSITGKFQLPPGPTELLFYGIVLILFVSFLPDGLVGLPRQAWSLLNRIRGKALRSSTHLQEVETVEDEAISR